VKKTGTDGSGLKRAGVKVLQMRGTNESIREEDSEGCCTQRDGRYDKERMEAKV